MKTSSRASAMLAMTLLCTTASWAQAGPWKAQSLTYALASTVLFGLVGILIAIVGFKLFDKFTPGNLEHEIIEEHNVAAAVIAGAMIIGVSIIIAAAVV